MKFNDFEYFIVTNDAVVGVFEENKNDVIGDIVCSKKGVYKEKILLNKDKVIEALYDNRLEIIQQIPEWFYFEGGFTVI